MVSATASSKEVQLLREENAALRAQIAWLKQQVFGPGKSEKLHRAQLRFQLEALEQLVAKAEQRVETITYERAKPAKEPRSVPAETFSKLPVVETIEIVPEAVKQEPALYERIGEERTFEVDVIEPKLVKREIVRPKFRHKLDRARPPLVAPAPARAVSGGYASAGLLAWIAISKYVHHRGVARPDLLPDASRASGRRLLASRRNAGALQ